MNINNRMNENKYRIFINGIVLKLPTTFCRLWQLRKFKTKDYKYKTPHGIFGENSEHKPSLAIATNGC